MQARKDFLDKLKKLMGEYDAWLIVPTDYGDLPMPEFRLLGEQHSAELTEPHLTFDYYPYGWVEQQQEN